MLHLIYFNISDFLNQQSLDDKPAIIGLVLLGKSSPETHGKITIKLN